MSRVTPPVNKFAQGVRRISSTANAARPSGLLDSRARNVYLPRPKTDLKEECMRRQLKTSGSKSELVERLATSDLINTRSFHTLPSGPRRPTTPPAPQIYKPIPLMQGFRSSAPKLTVLDPSAVDYLILPDPPAPPPSNPFSRLRVPLLPDNYSPDRSAQSGNAVETLDEAVPRPEISIIASHPENVAPATISEVVGNDGLDVDIGDLTTAAFGAKEEKESGVLRELWKGFVDDVIGSKGASSKVAV
ncbi:hypothetical protein LSUB1_G002317 [Lachnellula subtilissima]|uniref:SAP domain-containing protein n=1 Tax=Lachnellula subtilissima TaxID=602034 RepID=A0A8H8RMX3_9HELO|nr:hypothetical protein LSUB1_G002317 [Lachnellula subtilissima]